MFELTVHQYSSVIMLILFIKVNDFIEAGWTYFFLIHNHTPNQSDFFRSCRAHNRNEAKRLSAYALNHCFGVGRMWLKKADKSGNMPDANLLSASQNVRSNNWSSFLFSRQQKFSLKGGRSWMFASKTKRPTLHWEMFVKSGSSTTCCSFLQADVTVITTRTSQIHPIHGKGW